MVDGVEAGPTVVWCFMDGRPGHENQVRGLTLALSEIRPVDIHEIRTTSAGPVACLHAIMGRAPWGEGLPSPQMLVGAGHSTHIPLLASSRARGGRTVVLMKPSLPLAWFDLCVVPEHDGTFTQPNVLSTRGVLNPMRPSPEQRPDAGLILIGGPSRRHAWDDKAIATDVAAIVARDCDVQWTLTTSRRTPRTTQSALARLDNPNLRVIPFEQTDANWLPRHLPRAGRTWVSEDSVSMVYESLTAGAATGLLPVPRKGEDRVTRCMDRLTADGPIITFADWEAGRGLCLAGGSFNEARRCAAWIVEHWLKEQ